MIQCAKTLALSTAQDCSDFKMLLLPTQGSSSSLHTSPRRRRPARGGGTAPQPASLCSPRLFLLTSLSLPSSRSRSWGCGSPHGSWKTTEMSWRNCWRSCHRTPQTVLPGGSSLPREFCLSLLSPARHRRDIYIPQRALVSCLLTLQSAQIPRQLSCSWAGCSLSGVLSAPRSRYGLLAASQHCPAAPCSSPKTPCPSGRHFQQSL